MNWLDPYRDALSPYIFAEWSDGILLCGDCMDICPILKPKSVNLIVNDPPYNIGKADWDHIPNYLDWCGKWIAEAERVLMDNGSFYLFHNDFMAMMKLVFLIGEQTDFIFKQQIVWTKAHPDYGFAIQRLSNGTMRNYYSGFTEYLLYYTFQDETGLSRIYNDRDCFLSIKEYLRAERKKAGITYPEVNRILGTAEGSGQPGHYFSDSQWCLPTAEMYAKLQTTGYFQREYEDLRREYEDLRREYEDLRREYEDLRYTFNVGYTKDDFYNNSNTWFYPPVKNPVHPTQKPVPLIENIILHSSNEGDVVLDMFAGVSTLGVACVRNGRQFVCVEKEREYCAIGEKRINDEYERIAEEARQLEMFAAK